MKRYKYLLIIIHLFYGLNLFAQDPAIRFKHISYKDGLIQSPIASIVQDKSGYIWIGNWSGLFRYNGDHFKQFRKIDTVKNSISNNRVNKIFLDKDGNLWIATARGLNLYDKNTESFKHFGISAAKGGGNYIASIVQDSYGTIWASTFKGLKYFDKTKNDLVNVVAWKQLKNESELYEGVNYSLFEDHQKRIWVGIKQGLKIFDSRTKAIIPLPDVLKNNTDLVNSKIVIIKQDADGVYWMGTEEDGMFVYNPKTNSCKRYQHIETQKNSLPSNWINDILLKDSKVWIATRNGLCIYDTKSNNFSNYKHDSANNRSLNDDSVWSLMEDKTGNVWIGTYAGGLNLYYPGNSNFVNIGEKIGNNIGLNKPLANAIVADDDGLWIGTLGGGLNYINRKQGVVKYYSIIDPKTKRFSNEVKALVKDTIGNLWVGSLDGLCRFNIKTETIKYFLLNNFNLKKEGKLINTLVAGKSGIWIGTNGAGLRLVNYNGEELETFQSVSEDKGLSDNYINVLLNERDYLWIGTQNGLNRYHKISKTFLNLRRRGDGKIGLSNNNITTLYKDSKNTLWIGTEGGGLNYLDLKTNSIYHFKNDIDKLNDVIKSINEDNSGNLWISSNNGLSKIILKKMRFPLKTSDYSIITYTSSNGLLSNQFLMNSTTKTKSGELLFGGMNGVTAFYPDKIIKNKYGPNLLFTDLLLNNKQINLEDQILKEPINETSKLVLKYYQNNLTIKFSALNFINSDKNTYAYKMIGLSKNEDWQLIGNRKEVSFTNLEPGKYTFSAKAANNDGVWNQKGRSLQIIILPPIWKTWWAYLFYVILLIFIAYKIIQFFRIRDKLKRELYNEHLQNERQQEFYRMKLDFFTNISHEIRTPLTLILGPIENLYHATLDNEVVNKPISQIKNNAERLFRLISELMDFRKAETGNMMLYLKEVNVVPFIKEIYFSFMPLVENRNMNYSFKCKEEDISIYIDTDQLEKVFFNLLSNAFKFTPDHGEIAVEIINENEDFLEIKIIDNGRGIPLEYQEKLFTNYYQVQPDKSKPGTGVGLALSKSIIELHNGSITVESKIAKSGKAGTTVFSVKLPYQYKISENVQLEEESYHTDDIINYELKAEIELATQELPNQPNRYTVLLAEDNDELRTYIANSLTRYEIISCSNGSDALEIAVNKIPDLVISDVMMPGMNGLDLCKKLKDDDRTSHIPVVLLTALAAHIHQVNGFQTGADAYLTKPFSTKILELNVHNLLLSREQMRKKFAKQITLQPQNIAIASPDEKFIHKLMQIIENNMENPEFGVASLGIEIGMSKTVLYKKICSLTDLSPSDFLKSMRLKKAAFLLQQEGLNVNEVSSLVGFNDRKYFSKEFKKLHGISPSEMIAERK